jgi:hypothetical protein
MKRIIMLSTLAATMAVMVALAGSASAVEQPETATIHIEGTEVLANCGGFQVLDDFVLDATAYLFFDSAGNPDHAWAHVQVQDFVYNSKTGEGFAETAAFNEELQIVAPLDSGMNLITEQVGLVYKLTVPGEGVVLISAGRLVFEYEPEQLVVFEAGAHQGLEGATDKLCEALA